MCASGDVPAFLPLFEDVHTTQQRWIMSQTLSTIALCTHVRLHLKRANAQCHKGGLSNSKARVM